MLKSTNLNSYLIILLISIFFINTANGQSGSLRHHNHAQKIISKASKELKSAKAAAPFCISANTARKSMADEVINGKKDILELDISFNQSILNDRNETMRMSIPRANSASMDLQLKKVDFFSSSITSKNSLGLETDIAESSVFYWGIVEGDETSSVTISVFENEIIGTINTIEGNYTLGQLKNSDEYILYQETDLPISQEIECSASIDEDSFLEQLPTIHKSSMNAIVNPDNCVRQSFLVAKDLASEFDYDVQVITNYLTGFFSQLALVFVNDHINMRLEDISIRGANDECLSGPCMRTGDNYMELVTIGGGYGGGSVCVSGGRSGIQTTYENYPIIIGGMGTVAHEIGHGLGSPHTDLCFWNGNDTTIDDCGVSGNFEAGGPCFNPYNLNFPTGGSSIMSYCGNYLDFGEQPGDLIRHSVYTSTCLVTCDELPCIDADNNNVCDKDECNFNPIVCSAIIDGIRYGTPGAGGACDVLLYPGQDVKFDPRVYIAGSSSWTGPNGFTSTDEIITVSTPGIYEYTINDGFCTYTKQMTISLDNCGQNPIICNASSPNQACFVEYNQGDAIDIIMQPTTGTWSWTGPNGFTGSSSTITVSEAGEYNASYTEGGCTFTETVTLVQCAPNFLEASGRIMNGQWQNGNTFEIDHGQYAELRPYSTISTFGNWSWVGPNGFSDVQKETRNVRVVDPGIYTVSYFATSGVQACTYTKEFEVKMIDGSPTNNFPVAVADGTYFIEFTEVQNKRIIKVCDQGLAGVYPPEDNNYQRWSIQKNPNDEYFTIQNVATGKYLGVLDNIRQCEYAAKIEADQDAVGSDREQWRIHSMYGDFYLSARHCPARALSASGGTPNLGAYRSIEYGNTFQKIDLIPTSDIGPGFYEGGICDDGDICTINDVYVNCECIGIPEYNGLGVGFSCSDNLSCSDYSMLTENCNCVAATNFALTGTASSSSELDPNRPISNLNNGNFNDMSVTTATSPNEWMEIDLGANQFIDFVRILNRTDCCTDRVDNAYVLVADTPFPQNTDLTASLANADFTYQFGIVSTESELAVSIGQTGRYIRLQKSGNNNGGNYINIRELMVLGGIINPGTITGGGTACNSGGSITGTPASGPGIIQYTWERRLKCNNVYSDWTTHSNTAPSHSFGSYTAQEQQWRRGAKSAECGGDWVYSNAVTFTNTCPPSSCVDCTVSPGNITGGGTVCSSGGTMTGTPASGPGTIQYIWQRRLKCNDVYSDWSNSSNTGANLTIGSFQGQAQQWRRGAKSTQCGDDWVYSNVITFTNTCPPSSCIDCTVNLALTGTASASSEHDPNRPISNLNNGNFTDMSVTTATSPNEWMEIDLGANQFIDFARILNRTDCCTDRVDNAYVLVADTPFPQNTDLTASLANADFTYQFGIVSTESELDVNVGQTGRYIRLQKSGNNNGGNYINIRELIVLGGIACDDGNECSTNDTLDANCNCAGTFQDADNDGVCDANDICAGGDDTIDSDGDGIPDFCDSACNIGASCNDNNVCTTNDVYDANCNCAGTFQDADNDGVCDANDACSGLNDALIGTACDDGDPNTSNDTWGSDCTCTGTPAGGCTITTISSGGQVQSSNGAQNCRTFDFGGEYQDISFALSNVNTKVNGKPATRYSDLVTVQYVSGGNTQTHATYTSNSTVDILGSITTIIVCIEDNDGQLGASVRADVGAITSCVEGDNPPPPPCTIGAPCDDSDACTTGDVYDTNCNCAGTSVDVDNDGVCAANDPNDNDPCVPNACSGCTTYNAESFEGNWGIWNNGGNDVGSDATYANTGTNCVRLRDNSGQASSIYTDVLDLSAYSSLDVSFSFFASSMETGEDFYLEMSTNGGSSYTTVQRWVSGTDFTNGTRYDETVAVSGMSSSTRFRIRCDASANNDRVYIDDVVIEDCSGAGKVETEIGTVNIFPNPSHNHINVDLSQVIQTLDTDNIEVNIFSLDGKRVYQNEMQINDILHLNIDALSASQMYLLHLRTNDGRMFRGKFVKF